MKRICPYEGRYQQEVQFLSLRTQVATEGGSPAGSTPSCRPSERLVATAVAYTCMGHMCIQHMCYTADTLLSIYHSNPDL